MSNPVWKTPILLQNGGVLLQRGACEEILIGSEYKRKQAVFIL